jgi:hypothetical protein
VDAVIGGSRTELAPSSRPQEGAPPLKPPTNARITRTAPLAPVVLFIALVVAFPGHAWAASPADEACRDWYEEQAPDEQAREDNEAQLGQDVDGDGCTGILATPGSDGPVEGALEEGGAAEGGQGEDGSGDELAQAGDPRGGSETTTGGEERPDCAERFADETPEEQTREREEDLQFNVDNDKDGCIADQPAEGSIGADGAPADAPQGEAAPEAGPEEVPDDGGLTGMVLGFFKGIMGFVWDWTFGWALQEMAGAFETDLLSLPTLEGRGDLLGFYTGAVEKLRPAILVGILLLGILMMVRSDNYDLAYAGFQGLPRLMGVAMALAFLPQFMGELARITAGITEAFFPSGGDIDSAGQELFKAAIGNMAVTNFLNVVLLIVAAWVGLLLVAVALLNKILYAVLFVAGAFALTASQVPALHSLAGSWFRGVLASAAIPALWSIELGIGTLVVASPESIFGEMTGALGFVSEGAVTSLGAIITMWIMYKTPFKCVEWAFNVQLPGRGGLVGLAKAGAALAIAVPAKTAIATATKNLMNRSSGAGGGSMPRPTGEGSSTAGSGKAPASKGMPGREGAGSTGTARKIQQARTQGQRSRTAENVSKAHFKYARQRDQESKEKFMQGRSRGSRAAGLDSDRSGQRSGNKG